MVDPWTKPPTSTAEQPERATSGPTTPAPEVRSATGRNVLGTPQKPSQLRKNRGLCIAIVGDGGAGKTTLLGTLLESANAKPVCIFDMAGGSYVLSDDDDLDVFILTTQKEIDDKRQLLIRYAGTKDFRYKTVCWDVVTTMQKIGLRAKGLTPATAMGADNRRVYGSSNLDMEMFFTEQMNLAETTGLNIIMTFWDDTIQQGELVKHEMNITHGSALAAKGTLDQIFFLEKDSGRYPPVLITGENALYFTKNRASKDSPLRALPKQIYQPSLASIIDSFNGVPFPIERHTRKRSSEQ